MAAVLKFRGRGILSHRSAAAVWGLFPASSDEVTVTVTGNGAHSCPGLRVHRVKTFDPRHLRTRHGLPLSSPARTMIDLASEEADAELEEALAVARQRRLASDAEIRAAIEGTPGRRGLARLRRLLATGHASGFTRSKAERRMRALLRAAELPQPQANVPMLGHVADFVWPEHKLIVEVDGYLFHSDRRAFERDRRRDQMFAAAGYTVVRVTWAQLCQEPLAVVARVAQAVISPAA
jgi:very-short-patch-repair endonuclease